MRSSRRRFAQKALSFGSWGFWLLAALSKYRVQPRLRVSATAGILCFAGLGNGANPVFWCVNTKLPYLWLAGNEGREKKIETTILGHIVTTIRIQHFIPS